jgi:hypothetical protein
MTVQKLSLSLEDRLADEARHAADSSGKTLSAFVAEALRLRLKLDQARTILQDYEAEYGPISEQALSKARAKWPA